MIYNIQRQQGIYYPQTPDKLWLIKLVYSCSYRGFVYNKTAHWFRGESKDVFHAYLPTAYKHGVIK
jgi:hypothetical protein